jgi:hypothetical protein
MSDTHTRRDKLKNAQQRKVKRMQLLFFSTLRRDNAAKICPLNQSGQNAKPYSTLQKQVQKDSLSLQLSDNSLHGIRSSQGTPNSS